MKLPTIEQLHKGLLELLEERLETEPFILGARAGMGAELLAVALLSSTQGFVLDTVPTGGDPGLLARALTRRVIAAIQPLPLDALNLPDRDAERSLLKLADHYGSDLQAAITVATSPPGADTGEWTITRALGSFPNRPLLVVRDAHRLPDTVMWELRELAASSVRLLLLTTPEHRARLLDRDAPFYGMSAYAEMPTLSIVNWSTALRGQLPAEKLNELLRHTRYRTATTLEVLERHAQAGTDRPIAFAWFDAVDARGREARSVLTVARAIHDVAPRLLTALAGDAPPYSHTTERTDRVALALRRLRDYDLIEQPEPRRWQIADPLLNAAIRRLRHADDYFVELYPDTTDVP